MMLLLQRKPTLSRTKLSTGPHAARGLDIADLEFKKTSLFTLIKHCSFRIPFNRIPFVFHRIPFKVG